MNTCQIRMPGLHYACYSLQTIFAVCICKREQCAKEGHPRSWGWWVITPKWVRENRRGLSCPPGFPCLISISLKHMFVQFPNTGRHYEETVYIFPPILLSGFLTETNAEHPISSISGFQAGTMSWPWRMTTLGCSPSLCFAYRCPQSSVTSPPPTLYHQRRASLRLLFSCHRKTAGTLQAVSRIITDFNMAVTVTAAQAICTCIHFTLLILFHTAIYKSPYRCTLACTKQ